MKIFVDVQFVTKVIVSSKDLIYLTWWEINQSEKKVAFKLHIGNVIKRDIWIIFHVFFYICGTSYRDFWLACNFFQKEILFDTSLSCFCKYNVFEKPSIILQLTKRSKYLWENFWNFLICDQHLNILHWQIVD